MGYFNNGNNNGNSNSIAPRVSPEKMALYNALLVVLSHQAVTNQDAAWLGLMNNVPNPFSYSEELLQLQTSRLQAYLMLGAPVFPFPSDTKGIIFVDDAPETEVVQAFMMSGIPCYGAEWDEEEGLVGVEWSAYYTQIAFSPEGKAEVKTEAWTIPPFNKEEAGEPKELMCIGEVYQGCCPLVKPLAFYQVRHLVAILEGLGPEEMAEFVAGVTGMKVKEPGVVTLEPAFGNTLAWAEVTFDFVRHVISTGREFPQRLETFITHIGAIHVGVSMALQAIEIAGLDGETSQRRIDTMLASRTQVFEEEDNYGAAMFDDEQLRTIREHSIALLDVDEGWEYPYFSLRDNNNPDGVAQCIQWLIQEGREFFPDKNGMKRVVVDEGVTALMLGMVGDTGVFVTDVQREKKTMNRNWQAVAIRAQQGLPWMDGFREYRGSALRVMNRRYPAK
jgi:hypothetical protein